MEQNVILLLYWNTLIRETLITSGVILSLHCTDTLLDKIICTLWEIKSFFLKNYQSKLIFRLSFYKDYRELAQLRAVL